MVGNAKEAALRLQGDMRRDVSDARLVRWERPPNMHLTLQFLGDTPHEDLEGIKSELAEVAGAHRAFELELESPLCFGRGQPRVLVVGLGAGRDLVTALQANVVRHLDPLGYPGDHREYHPHLTIGRVRRGKRMLTMNEATRLIERNLKITRGEPMRVVEFVLYRSELTPEGAVYSRLATFSLAR
jgi:2'-5' RNA ligase